MVNHVEKVGLIDQNHTFPGQPFWPWSLWFRLLFWIHYESALIKVDQPLIYIEFTSNFIFWTIV